MRPKTKIIKPAEIIGKYVKNREESVRRMYATVQIKKDIAMPTPPSLETLPEWIFLES